MKRRVLGLFLAALLLAGIGFVGCSTEEEQTDGTTTLSFVTVPVGGGAYVAGIGIADILNRFSGASVTPEASVGSVRNVELMDQGLAEMALLSSIDAYDATHGVAPRFEKKHEFSILATGHISIFQMFVREDSPIETLYDLQGSGARIWNTPLTRKIGGVWLAAYEGMSEYYGFTDDDFTVVSYYSLSAIADAFKEGRHDMVYYTGGVPIPTFTELTSLIDCRFLGIDEDILDNICDENPFFFPYTMEAGSYEGQDEDVHLIGYVYFVVVKNDLDEELVYDMAEALYEHPDELTAVHPSLSDVSVDFIGRNTVAPWHPGAVQYLKDKGVWTAEMEDLQSSLLSEVG